MAKLICLTLENGLLQSNQYTTPKGNTYLFHKGIPTEVVDEDDLKFFLSVAGGSVFKRVDGVRRVVSKVKEKVKKEPMFVEGVPNPKHEWTESELFKLNKKEQVELLKRLGGSGMRIPKLEKDRVKLILKLLSKA